MNQRMKKMQNKKIEKLLPNTFIVLIAATVIIGLSSIYSIISIGNDGKSALVGTFSKLSCVKNWQLDIQEYENSVYKSALAGKPEKAESILAEAESKLTASIEEMTEAAKESDNDEYKEYVEKIQTAYKYADQYDDQIPAYIEAGQQEELYQLTSEVINPIFDEMDTCIEGIVDCLNASAEHTIKYVNIREIWATIFNVVLLAIVVYLSYKNCKIIVKLITQPLKEIEFAMAELSEGKFSIDLAYESENEFGNLANKIRETIAKLKKYITIEEEVLAEISDMNMNVEIEEDFVGDFKAMQDSIEKIIVSMNDMFLKTRNSAEVIDGASEQVSAVAQALAVSATQQASSMEELVATINQVTENVTDNAKMANQMSITAKDVNEKIESGKQCMDELNDAMQAINKKSEDIAEFISVINDIADQTNLLSLNASIEASRAGEYGKGFGVVASEIGKLAGQCADAVKETERLVKESLSAVSQGTAKVGESMKLMQEIVDSNVESSRCIEEVSSVCEQQAAALQQTLAGSNQIAEAIQENSGMAEESSASSEELTAQVVELNQMLQKCQIKEAI